MSITTEHEESFLKSVELWAAFYRANPQRFVEDYLGVKLKLFQKILIFMMNISNFFCYIAARGQGKSFLLAVFCCVRCILYPGTKVVIASGTRGQSLNILEKIKIELFPRSPLLRNEIEDIKLSASNAYVLFKNGSSIKVVTASDSARGNRATILLVDEFRMVDKETIGTVLRKFLTDARHPGYIDNPKYQHLIERNKEIYLSSAYYKDNWSYDKVCDYTEHMVSEDNGFFVCGLPYQLSMYENLLNRDAVADEMSEVGFNEITWSMEMECLFWGDESGTFFSYDSISKTRKLKYPMLPSKVAALLGNNNKIHIPSKLQGEIRILSADIALMSSKKNRNDASALFVNQMLPSRNGHYINNIVYSDSAEGLRTDEQALMIRRLYEEFLCDYIVLDCQGIGLGVFDALSRDIVDPDTGEIYAALSCCNNAEMASRCISRSADKVIWAMKANSDINSECALRLREGFRSGKIRLLIHDQDGDAALSEIKGYSSLSESERLELKMPYVHTTLLIDELIKLQHEESSGKVRISEKSGMRKDRYSSLSYNYYVATQLESKLGRRRNSTSESPYVFRFRAPKIR